MRGRGEGLYEIVVGACLATLGLVVRFGESICVSTMLEARDSRDQLCGNYDSGNICALYDNFEFTAESDVL